MSVFRFRAQAALDVRLRELEAAKRELALAEQDRDIARCHVGKADVARKAAWSAQEDHPTAGRAASEQEWYRFWILRLEAEHREAVAKLEAQEVDVGERFAACAVARQRWESLEHLRDKARLAHDGLEAALERRLFDEIATIRFNGNRDYSSGAHQ